MGIEVFSEQQIECNNIYESLYQALEIACVTDNHFHGIFQISSSQLPKKIQSINSNTRAKRQKFVQLHF